MTLSDEEIDRIERDESDRGPPPNSIQRLLAQAREANRLREALAEALNLSLSHPDCRRREHMEGGLPLLPNETEDWFARIAALRKMLDGAG